MITITIEKSALRAISKFAAKDDIRYYFNGVCLELGADEARLVATNGHMLGVMRLKYAEGDKRPNETLQAIIPAELVKGIKAPKKKESLNVLVQIDGDVVTFTDPFGYDGSRTSKLIDAKYPDWRRIVSRKPSGKVAQFNPEYVRTFLQARAELGNDLPSVTISHNGDGAALVSIGRDDFVGVLMPIRIDVPLDAIPDWVAAPISKANQK